MNVSSIVNSRAVRSTTAPEAIALRVRMSSVIPPASSTVGSAERSSRSWTRIRASSSSSLNGLVM